MIWGVGPAFLFPTATRESMGTGKWAAGPTGVVLKQIPAGKDIITVGALANHLWDFAGRSDKADVNQTFVQPFFNYTTPSAWTYAVNFEGIYNWEEKEASIPLNLAVSKVMKIGNQPISLQAGVGRWLDSPDDTGPEGWRFRTGITFIFKE